MKFVCLSDIHAVSKNPVGRKDEIDKTFIKKMIFVLSYAKEHKAKILQAGDFFHRPRDWRLLNIMVELINKYKVDIYTIYGQHDMYMYSDVEDSPTTMSILAKTGHFHILSGKPVRFGEVYVYGASYGSRVPRPKGDVNVLVIHAPIAAKEVYPDQDYASPEYFMRKNKKYDLIVAGDVHRQFIKNLKTRQLVNTGPMLRLEATEYNMKHRPSLFVWDSKTFSLEKIEIPHKRAFRVLSREHIETSQDVEDAIKNFTDTMKRTRIDFLDITDAIEKLVESSNASMKVKRIISKAMEE